MTINLFKIFYKTLILRCILHIYNCMYHKGVIYHKVAFQVEYILCFFFRLKLFLLHLKDFSSTPERFCMRLSGPSALQDPVIRAPILTIVTIYILTIYILTIGNKTSLKK